MPRSFKCRVASESRVLLFIGSTVSAVIPNDYYIEAIYSLLSSPFGISRAVVSSHLSRFLNRNEPSRGFVILITGADELVEWR